MIFHDNVIKEYLKNVYFLTGTPCGGKTTISRALAKKHGFMVYDVDERFPTHQQMSDSKFQPAMNKEFRDADEFFGRSVEEYKKWLIDNTREQLDFVLLDLIRLSQNQTVLCDCHLRIEEADALTDLSRIAFLIKEPKNLVDEYCNRIDHHDFRDFINSSTDVEKAKRTCNKTLEELNADFYNKIKNGPYFWIERTSESTIEETVHMVETHFGW
jgi:adenylate kinase family enzyme